MERYKTIISTHSNIEYLGSVSFEEMQKLYVEADLLLNCSLHDSGCMVILEAMSFGVPVIGIDTGGPHILMDDGSCVRIKPDKVENMVDKISQEIVRLKNDSGKLTEMSINAITRAENFGFDRRYDAIINALHGNY